MKKGDKVKILNTQELNSTHKLRKIAKYQHALDGDKTSCIIKMSNDKEQIISRKFIEKIK